jgi:LysM repeat protein
MRRLPLALPLLAASLASFGGSAAANVPHTVMPGETLWSIAAANGFSTRSFAAANGLSPDAQVVLGSTLQIPSVSQAAAALSSGASGAPAANEPDGDDGTPATASISGAPPPLGGYTVRPGDTLSGIAARAGVPPGQIAFMNGLSTSGVLLAGTVLKLPTGAPLPSTAPAPAQRIVPQAAPSATPGRVTSSQIAQLAAANGVPASLASAIGWQESGFNNGTVSNANARGVMQIMPGTWQWIQGNLAARRLDPNSALDNVGAGVLYLRSLLRSTGGDAALAAAAYYQGLGSVRRIGLLPATQRYVNNVQALRSRFGGP